jgi:hypothetical protein
MMTDHIATPPFRKTRVPFAPSWIDRTIAWIDRLPGDTWLFYLLSLLAVDLLLHVIFWVDGAVPVWSFSFVVAANGFFVIYWLALYHYLTKIGSRSLRLFRPLLKVPDSEIPAVDYRLATLPSRLGWLAVPFGVVFGVTEVLPGAEPFGDLVPKTSLPIVLDVLATVFLASTFLCLIIRSIRQLRMVRELHTQASNINLLKLEPTHAFSLLTSRTGMGVVFVFIFAYILQPSAFRTTFSIVMAVAFATLAIAIFVLPIIGIRDQIEDEKQNALYKTSDLLSSARDDLHSKVSRRAYDEFKGIENSIAALVRERELLEGVPTWPWNPETIRGFASTLLLPIFLWLATKLLERLL